MTMAQRVANELVRRLKANNFEEITIEMKCNGDKITITPCSYVDIKSVDDIDYYLVDCRLPWAGNDNLMWVANFILNYQQRIDENEVEKKKLRAYYNKYHNTDKMDWDWYINWYKDVYGHRP